MRTAAVIVLLGALAAAGCEDTDRISALEREKASLEKKVQKLEEAAERSKREAEAARAGSAVAGSPAQAGTSGSGDQDLADCRARLERCEKDPFTGTKYLADPAGGGKKEAPSE